MAWTFKDRYDSNRKISIDSEFFILLRVLEETLDDFQRHSNLNEKSKTKLISMKGINYAKAIYIHTQISYCLGAFDCNQDLYFDHYREVVRKHFINVHPVFAAKKYAECIALIRSENDKTEK